MCVCVWGGGTLAVCVCVGGVHGYRCLCVGWVGLSSSNFLSHVSVYCSMMERVHVKRGNLV